MPTQRPSLEASWQLDSPRPIPGLLSQSRFVLGRVGRSYYNCIRVHPPDPASIAIHDNLQLGITTGWRKKYPSSKIRWLQGLHKLTFFRISPRFPVNELAASRAGAQRFLKAEPHMRWEQPAGCLSHSKNVADAWRAASRERRKLDNMSSLHFQTEAEGHPLLRRAERKKRNEERGDKRRQKEKEKKW